MADNELITLVERFYCEIINGDKISSSEELLSEDFFIVTPASVYYGRADCIVYLARLKESLDGFEMKVNGLTRSKDAVVAEIDICGTPVKEFLGMPPSFKYFEVPATCTFKFAGDRIKSMIVNYDLTELLKRE